MSAKLDKLEGEAQPPPAPKSRKPQKTDTMLGIEIADEARGGVRIVDLTQPHKGLRAGDIIVEMNGTPVNSVDELRAAMKKSQSGDAVLFKIRRNDRHRYVGIPLTH